MVIQEVMQVGGVWWGGWCGVVDEGMGDVGCR